MKLYRRRLGRLRSEARNQDHGLRGADCAGRSESGSNRPCEGDLTACITPIAHWRLDMNLLAAQHGRRPAGYKRGRFTDSAPQSSTTKAT
ncbi:hypothetical protein AcW1_002545 [Taiwanofungus camphoratus]|nr:hypothetical protein AcW1_002545 [Antrodia cinnamomea]KAI0943371.1 hypothetical protein AcW1_002545 [Antrodia cinnamomea]